MQQDAGCQMQDAGCRMPDAGRILVRETRTQTIDPESGIRNPEALPIRNSESS
jgi:hypothetical protein